MSLQPGEQRRMQTADLFEQEGHSRCSRVDPSTSRRSEAAAIGSCGRCLLSLSRAARQPSQSIDVIVTQANPDAHLAGECCMCAQTTCNRPDRRSGGAARPHARAGSRPRGCPPADHRGDAGAGPACAVRSATSRRGCVLSSRRNALCWASCTCLPIELWRCR